MAKPVSDQELSASMKSVGGFGALTGRRAVDSPFRDSRAEPKTVELPVRIEEPQTAPAKQEPYLPKNEPPTVAVPKARAEAVTKPKKAKTGQRKADIYTERVTVQMSPEMRDEVDELARQLQRAKTTREERITANSVIRSAVRLVLERFELTVGDSPNSEDELFELFRSRCEWR